MSLTSKINDLLDSPSSRESQLLSMRIESSIVNQIDELASELDRTRSDLMTAFITGGIEELVKQLEQRDALIKDDIPTNNEESNIRYFLLNTNYNNSPPDHFLMLKNGEAAAFCSGFKENIERLKENDIVFLYHSGHGICGYGSANSKLNTADYGGIENDRYSRVLNNFAKFKPITAKTCKDITKSNFNFRKTMSILTKEQGEAIVKKIRELIAG